MRRIEGEEAWALNTRRHGLGHRIFIAEEVDEWGRDEKDRIRAMAYSRDWAEEVWTRTMAWPLNRLDLPFELSFGATAIRRRIGLFITWDKAITSSDQ